MEKIKNLLQDVVQNLVDGKVVIRELKSNKMLVYEIQVEPSEVAKVIGGKGKIIKAIKTLFVAIGAKNDRKVIVDVVNSNGNRKNVRNIWEKWNGVVH